MIVMFTSPAYSAVHSNNLQSASPEGRYRLKMSNLFSVRHVCRDVVLITGGFRHNVVKADTSCYTRPHTNRTPCGRKLHERLAKGGVYESGLWLCQACSQITPHFSETKGKYRASYITNPTCSTCDRQPESMIALLYVACKGWMIAHMA